MNKIFWILSAVLSGFLHINTYSQDSFSSWEQAKKHPIVRNTPSPDFFEGALIGNGGMGVVVCTRPDAVVLRFGHNDVWDIRIAEENREAIGDLREVFEKVQAINPNLMQLEDDPWYAKYKRLTRENYAKPYPRPFPCGSVIIGFDRRKVELLGHSLDISDGLVRVKFLLDKRDTAYLNVFADSEKDRVWMKLEDGNGDKIPSCFNRIHVIPDVKTPREFPKYTMGKVKNGISFKQILPYLEPDKYSIEKGDPRDKAFSPSVVTDNKLLKKQRPDRVGNLVDMDVMEYAMTQENPFWLCAELRNGLASELSEDFSDLEALDDTDYAVAFNSTHNAWKNF